MQAPPADFSRAPRLYWLADPGAENDTESAAAPKLVCDPELVGDEVACLGRLAPQIRVPAGFCMTALSPHDLLPQEIDALWSMLTTAYSRLQDVSGQPEPRLVVRRSVCVGQTNMARPPTFVNIVGIDGLAASVYEMLAWPAPARSREPDLDPHALGGRGRSAVLVQLLTPAEATAQARGVGRDGDVEIRATWGLGAHLSEPATPADTYRYDRELRLVHREIAGKERMTVLSDGGVVDVFVPRRLRKEPCLADSEAPRIADLYDRARRLLGAALTVTVSLVDGDLVAVSCRTQREDSADGLTRAGA